MSPRLLTASTKRSWLMVATVGLILAACSSSLDGSTTSSTRSPRDTSPSTSDYTTPTSTTVEPTTVSTGPSTTFARQTTTSTMIVTTTLPTSTTTTTGTVPALVVTLLPTTEAEIALTFDAGSDRGYAAEILDFLAEHDIRASFGMTGRWAETNPDLVRRMADEGHVLMNHTYDHPHMETLSTQLRLEQLERAEGIVGEITGVSMKPFFRPPYGSYNNRVLADIGSAGYRYSVMWSVDCLGWKGLDPSAVAAHCIEALHNGAILLMHVGGASTDYAALGDIVAAIDREGYRYVTIREVLP